MIAEKATEGEKLALFKTADETRPPAGFVFAIGRVPGLSRSFERKRKKSIPE